MSIKLEKFGVDLKSLPYFKNCHATSGIRISGHEDAIADLLSQNGFQRCVNKDFPKLKDWMIKDWEKNNFQPHFITNLSDTKYKTKPNKTFGMMLNGSFLSQPTGSQNFPDFLVRDFDGRFIIIEAKSGKKGKKQLSNVNNSTPAPMWNNSLPKPFAVVYVLSNEKVNGTTFFLGQDVISDVEYQWGDTCIKAQIQLYENQQKNAPVDFFKRGWITKSRPQFFQGGGLHLTDYFKHQDRQNCENKVLAFFKN
jgi:hypothetical protein